MLCPSRATHLLVPLPTTCLPPALCLLLSASAVALRPVLLACPKLTVLLRRLQSTCLFLVLGIQLQLLPPRTSWSSPPASLRGGTATPRLLPRAPSAAHPLRCPPPCLLLRRPEGVSWRCSCGRRASLGRVPPSPPVGCAWTWCGGLLTRVSLNCHTSPLGLFLCLVDDSSLAPMRLPSSSPSHVPWWRLTVFFVLGVGGFFCSVFRFCVRS